MGIAGNAKIRQTNPPQFSLAVVTAIGVLEYHGALAFGVDVFNMC